MTHETSGGSVIPASSKEVIRSKIHRFNQEKVVAVLGSGFRVERTHPTDGFVEAAHLHVVTRLNEDLFTVNAHYSYWPENMDNGEYKAYSFHIARRKLIWPEKGSAYLDRWEIDVATDQEPRQDFRRRDDKQGLQPGSLEEVEFWKKFNGSDVDPDATQTYFGYMRDEYIKRYGRRDLRTSWMTETANAQTPIVLIDQPAKPDL